MTEETTENLNEVMKVRREKLAHIQQLDVNPVFADRTNDAQPPILDLAG